MAHDAEAARQRVDGPEAALVPYSSTKGLHGHLLKGFLARAAHPQLVGRDVRAAVVHGRPPLHGHLAVAEHGRFASPVVLHAVRGHGDLHGCQRRHGRARVSDSKHRGVRKGASTDQVRVPGVAVVHRAHREPVLLTRLQTDGRSRSHHKACDVDLVRAVEDHARPAARPLVHPQLVAHDPRAAVLRRVVPRHGQRNAGRIDQTDGRRRARRVPRGRLELRLRQFVDAKAQVVVPPRARVVALARR